MPSLWLMLRILSIESVNVELNYVANLITNRSCVQYHMYFHALGFSRLQKVKIHFKIEHQQNKNFFNNCKTLIVCLVSRCLCGGQNSSRSNLL